MFSDLKICIIGDGTHSKRIQNILKKKKIAFTIFKPISKKRYKLENIDHLKKNDAIFIISPDHTHCHYVKKLYKFCYIFCEKPPCNNTKDLKNLLKIKSNKIYYNFNFRFSKISEILKHKERYKLGNLIYANIIDGHGLGLKKEYKDSWRSKIKETNKGILEIVTIHWIDLINFLFKIKKIEKPKLINLSKYGNSYDNSLTRIEINKKSFVDIFTSYTSPLIGKKNFVFENGLLEQNYKEIIVKGPAINLDKNKFFKKPKVLKVVKYNNKSDAMYSLTKSVDYFLNIIINRKSFPKNEAKLALLSNKYIL